MPTVALVTCAAYPDLDDDDRAVVPALAGLGIDAVPAVWDDPAVDWDRFDLAVIRSTWDYVDRVADLVAWTERVPRLANPAGVVAWDVDKRYLAGLAAAGVPVVPTTFVAPGEPVPASIGGEVVVKPTVSAGARDTLRFDDPARIAEHTAGIHATGRTVMIQPYVESVEARGETAVIFLGGEHSHAACKAALLPEVDSSRFDGLYALETMTPRIAADDELAVARAALAAVPGPTLYARIDLLRGDDGAPMVLEVEVTEPSLFLRLGDGAVDRFAAAIAAWLGT